MAKGFTFLGTRARSSVSNYADSSVVGWPWGWTNQDSWGSCDTLPSSIAYGELMYFDIHLTTSNKDARVFVLANSKSGTTLYSRNIVCYAADGTKIAGVNLTSGGSGYGGIDFDDLFEAAIGDLPGTTFANLSPTCKYSGYSGNYANYRGFFKNGSTAYDAGRRGLNPSNTVIYTSPQGSGTYTISKAEGGVSVNGTTYYNSSRGSYPYDYVGLLICGGGGGGGGGGSSRGGGGGGGGGGGVALCLLDLDSYPYYISLSDGSGGAGGSSSTDGGNGGQVTLEVTLEDLDSKELILYANGGVGGNKGTTTASGSGGAGGDVYISDESYCTIIAYANGGAGGRGGPRSGTGSAAGNCSCSGYLVGTASSSRVTAGSGGGTAARSQGGAGGGSIGNGAGPASGHGSAGSYGSGGAGGYLSYYGGAGGGGCFKLYY